MGYGLGVVGLSLHDLEQLTPDEFGAVCDAHSRQTEDHVRDAWQRTRILATISVQPHTTRAITPEQLLPLPWDKPTRPKAEEAPELSREEQRARAHALAEQLKNNP